MSRARGKVTFWVVWAVVSCGFGGCSWIFIQELPEDHRRGDRTECTTSPVAPIADTLLAASNLGGALYVAGTVGDKATPAQNALVTTALVWTIVYTTAAVHGYRATAACREAVAEEDEWPRGPLILRPRAAAPVAPAEPATRPAVPSAEPAPVPAVPSAPASPQQQDDDEPGRRPATPPHKPRDTFGP